MEKNNKLYIDDEKFTQAVSEYHYAYLEAKTKEEELPRISEYIGKCIYLIAHNISTKYNWSSYSYKEDMVSEACLVCCKYLHNFDPERVTKKDKASAFSYASFNISQAFMAFVNNEHKENYLKWKSLSVFADYDLFDNEEELVFTDYDAESESPRGLMMNDISSKVYAFEEKMEDKRKIQKEKYRQKQNEKNAGKPNILHLFADIYAEI